MKILVFSDSHRSRRDMISAVQQERPDMLLHLGDLLKDAEELGLAFPALPMVRVPGNCDGWTTEPHQLLITVENTRILLAHGHTWNVKQGYNLAISAGKKADAHILLFGHTHNPYCQIHDRMWVMNPGASRAGYGVILLEQGQIHCHITKLI